ncbi:HAD family hydrolase [Viridibacillus sp. NPDC096237]|uniref:HAD family hydrolase n=1 Tax=Viridibacillus sp. NPDC096237 TaxID=3390721 RepID=UPI003D062EA1
MKILFTSDLDRTLIYSNHMMSLYPTNAPKTAVEHKGDVETSWMCDNTIELLKEVKKKTIFVPVTTRARHQYERIHFIQNLHPVVAVTSNGGTILESGKPDTVWAKQLRQSIEDSSIPDEQMLNIMKDIKYSNWMDQSFYVDDLFYVNHVHLENVQEDALQQLKEELHEFGWHLLLQKKKLYMIPNVLTKEAAVSYIKNKYSFDFHFAAGDSILDYNMLAMADRSYTPLHGDMKDKEPEILTQTHYSNENGTAFTEELLQDVLDHVNRVTL